jgi:hypothetical protein
MGQIVSWIVGGIGGFLLAESLPFKACLGIFCVLISLAITIDRQIRAKGQTVPQNNVG